MKLDDKPFIIIDKKEEKNTGFIGPLHINNNPVLKLNQIYTETNLNINSVINFYKRISEESRLLPIYCLIYKNEETSSDNQKLIRKNFHILEEIYNELINESYDGNYFYDEVSEFISSFIYLKSVIEIKNTELDDLIKQFQNYIQKKKNNLDSDKIAWFVEKFKIFENSKKIKEMLKYLEVSKIEDLVDKFKELNQKYNSKKDHMKAIKELNKSEKSHNNDIIKNYTFNDIKNNIFDNDIKDNKNDEINVEEDKSKNIRKNNHKNEESFLESNKTSTEKKEQKSKNNQNKNEINQPEKENIKEGKNNNESKKDNYKKFNNKKDDNNNKSKNINNIIENNIENNIDKNIENNIDNNINNNIENNIDNNINNNIDNNIGNNIDNIGMGEENNNNNNNKNIDLNNVEDKDDFLDNDNKKNDDTLDSFLDYLKNKINEQNPINENQEQIKEKRDEFLNQDIWKQNERKNNIYNDLKVNKENDEEIGDIQSQSLFQKLKMNSLEDIKNEMRNKNYINSAHEDDKASDKKNIKNLSNKKDILNNDSNIGVGLLDIGKNEYIPPKEQVNETHHDFESKLKINNTGEKIEASSGIIQLVQNKDIKLEIPSKNKEKFLQKKIDEKKTGKTKSKGSSDEQEDELLDEFDKQLIDKIISNIKDKQDKDEEYNVITKCPKKPKNLNVKKEGLDYVTKDLLIFANIIWKKF